jgi:hypothetical protein
LEVKKERYHRAIKGGRQRLAGILGHILADQNKLAEFDLTSAELDAVKKMDPTAVKAIADRIGKRAMEGSQACQACASREMQKRPM